MMNTLIKFMTAMVLLGASVHTSALAQQKYRMDKEDYALKIKGTSNVHDWTMEAESVSGMAVARLGDNGLQGFDRVNITVQSKQIESGKRIMNNKTYDALEADDHPTIFYELISVSNLKSSGEQFSGKATGKLEIAGESSITTVPFEGRWVDDNTFRVNGNFSLEMTDFGIDPPTAMLGTLKTGNKISLKFEFTFNQ
jgi:polyisoprenoid-binding protein YceI